MINKNIFISHLRTRLDDSDKLFLLLFSGSDTANTLKQISLYYDSRLYIIF